MNRFDDLDKMIHDCWHLLVKAAIKRKGDYQTPVIATQGEQQADIRIVVLREVDLDTRSLLFFTDARAAKVEQLQRSPRMSWLFWDAGKKVQMRMYGKVELHLKDKRCQKYWDRLPVPGRKSYAATVSPGSPVNTDTDGLPDFWSADMKLEDSAYAFDNFMVVECQIDQVELLHLHREGHQRAVFHKDPKGWDGQWLIP